MRIRIYLVAVLVDFKTAKIKICHDLLRRNFVLDTKPVDWE